MNEADETAVKNVMDASFSQVSSRSIPKTKMDRLRSEATARQGRESAGWLQPASSIAAGKKAALEAECSGFDVNKDIIKTGALRSCYDAAVENSIQIRSVRLSAGHFYPTMRSFHLSTAAVTSGGEQLSETWTCLYVYNWLYNNDNIVRNMERTRESRFVEQTKWREWVRMVERKRSVIVITEGRCETEGHQGEQPPSPFWPT